MMLQALTLVSCVFLGIFLPSLINVVDGAPDLAINGFNHRILTGNTPDFVASHEPI